MWSNLVNVRINENSSAMLTYKVFSDDELNTIEKDNISRMSYTAFLEYAKSKGWHTSII